EWDRTGPGSSTAARGRARRSLREPAGGGPHLSLEPRADEAGRVERARRPGRRAPAGAGQGHRGDEDIRRIHGGITKNGVRKLGVGARLNLGSEPVFRVADVQVLTNSI